MATLTRSAVLSIQTSYDDIHRSIGRLDEVLDIAGIRAARKIGIKINLCDARTPDTGAITDPRFLDALLEWLRGLNADAEVAVLESDGLSVLADNYRDWFGIDEILDKWEAGWINLTREPQVPTTIAGRHLKEVPVPQILKEAYLISLSKLKTNLLSTITCALKNQYGCLPMVDKFKYHTDLSDVITDINLAVPVKAFIVDGIRGHGGIQGPAFGTPIHAGVVLAGRDPVAVDAACCKVMGYRPTLVSHVRKCWLSGLGSIRYELLGDPLPDVDFENKGIETRVFMMGGAIKRFYQRLDRRRSA